MLKSNIIDLYIYYWKLVYLHTVIKKTKIEMRTKRLIMRRPENLRFEHIIERAERRKHLKSGDTYEVGGKLFRQEYAI